jgi:hypothetical protein
MLSPMTAGLTLAKATLEQIAIKEGPHGEYARFIFRTADGLLVSGIFSTIKGATYQKLLQAFGISDPQVFSSVQTTILYGTNGNGYRQLAHIVTGLLV